jgi:hypothetical protein
MSTTGERLKLKEEPDFNYFFKQTSVMDSGEYKGTDFTRYVKPQIKTIYVQFCKNRTRKSNIVNNRARHKTRCGTARAHVSGFGGLGISALDLGTQVREFKLGRSRRIFQGEKILSAPSFGREVKPWVPCR